MSNLTKQCRDKTKLQEIAQRALELFLEECNRQKLNVLIVETLRTKERQYFLACKGRTVSQAIAMGVPKSFAEKYASPKEKQVTWTLNSNHLEGMAFDFCKNVKGQEYKDKVFFDKCGRIVQGLGLEWGGAFGDSPHVQVPKRWKEPTVKEDKELKKAVTKIIDSEIQINDASWNRLDRINLKNVPALLNKLGGVDRLVAEGIISDTTIWVLGKYNTNHVRSLLIKYGSRL